MEIPNGLVIGLASFGFFLAVLLWWWLALPLWAAMLIAIASPFLFFVVLSIAFLALWIASGGR